MLSKKIVNVVKFACRSSLCESRGIAASSSLYLQPNQENPGIAKQPSILFRKNDEGIQDSKAPDEGIFKKAAEKMREDYDPQHPIASTMKGTKDVVKEAAHEAKEAVEWIYDSVKQTVSPDHLAKEKIGEAVEQAMSNSMDFGAEEAKKLHPVTHPEGRDTFVSETSRQEAGGDDAIQEMSDYRDNTELKQSTPSKATGVKDMDEGVIDAAKKITEPIAHAAKDIKDYTVDKAKGVAKGMKQRWDDVKEAEDTMAEKVRGRQQMDYSDTERQRCDEEDSALPRATAGEHGEPMGLETTEHLPDRPTVRHEEGLSWKNADPLGHKTFTPQQKQKHQPSSH